MTFYHIISSVPGVIPARFSAPVTVSLLPTLLSAYVARGPQDLYLPVKLLALENCRGPNGGCRLREDIEAWAVHHLFVEPQPGARHSP